MGKKLKEKPAKQFTKHDVTRGLIEIAGLLLILALVIVLFMKLAPYSSRSGIYAFTVEVRHTDADPEAYDLKSSADDLAEALEGCGLMTVAEDGAVTVDGETAVWTLTLNGEAVDSAWEEIPLKTGDAFVLTPEG